MVCVCYTGENIREENDEKGGNLTQLRGYATSHFISTTTALVKSGTCFRKHMYTTKCLWKIHFGAQFDRV